MPTVELLPVASIVSEWLQFPNDGSPHYLKVDEGIALSDEATTELRVKISLRKERFRLAPLPGDFNNSNSILLQVIARADYTGATYLSLDVNFYVGGVLKFTENIFFDPIGGPYAIYDFPINLVELDPSKDNEVEVIAYVTDDAPPTLNNKIFLTAVALQLDYSVLVFFPVTDPATDYTNLADPPALSLSPIADGSTTFTDIPTPTPIG